MWLKPPENFVTSRLRARLPRREDAPAVFAAYASDREVTRYLSWAAYDAVEPLAAFLDTCRARWATGEGHLSWLLCLRDSDTPIGSIGVEIGGGKAMFGYVLARQHWGQGLMAEALSWGVDWALAQPAIYRAWAFCDVDNPASARVMEKAGLQREARLARWHVCPGLGPEPRDCLVYARVK